MKQSYFAKVLVVVLFFMVPVNLFSASILVDPRIPNNEKVTYRISSQNNSSIVTERAIRKKDGTEIIYEITFNSQYEDRTIRINRSTMLPTFINVIQKKTDMLLERKITVLKNKSGNENELALVDPVTLIYVLRGFPFKELKSTKIAIPGERDAFSMYITMTGETTIKVQNKNFHCYKLETSITGMMKDRFPKSCFWYNYDEPHFLVKYEGPTFDKGPLLGQQTIELLGYSVGNK